ncbi:zinc finger protein 431-like [Wyeomyia smithii]|uniref:zinc finger protein 431-like n=1 Tax=Wyeomyia smithii TaxID=174621 RepID=UPI002467F0D8|nr:zinc finger protein 431-like [Wyeomyia smithii]
MASDLEDSIETLVCRICTIDCSQLQYVSIYERSDEKSLAEMIAFCGQIEINSDDDLPKIICTGCWMQLLESYRFCMRCRTGDEKLRNELEPQAVSKSPIDELVATADGLFSTDDTDEGQELPNKSADELMEPSITESKDQNEILVDFMTSRDDELFDAIIEEEIFSDDDIVFEQIPAEVVALPSEDHFVESERQEPEENYAKVFTELQNVPIAEMQEVYKHTDLEKNSSHEEVFIAEEVIQEEFPIAKTLCTEFLEEVSSNLEDENFSETVPSNPSKSTPQRRRTLQLPPQEMIVDQEDHGDYAIVYYTGVTCCGCDKYFADSEKLENHCRDQHHCKDSLEVYDCELCYKTFPSLNHKKRHQSLRSVPKLFSCTLCNYVCWEQSAIDRHMKSALLHNKSMLEFDKVKEVFDEVKVNGNLCCECYQIFSSNNQLEQHYDDEHRKGRPKCPTSKTNWCLKCFQLFKNEYKYATHRQNASADVIYRCKQEFCNYRTASLIFARFHLRSQDHTEIRISGASQENLEDNGEHRCCFRKCSNKFGSLEALRNHVDQVHQAKQLENELRRKKSTNVCSICNCNFGTRKALRIHRQMKQKDFVCDQCGLVMGSSFHLQQHIDLVHQETKVQHKFSCKTCQRSFVSEQNLQRHISKGHTSGGEHVCNVCGKKFAGKHNLWTHWRTHVSTEKFECEVCKKAGKRYLFRDIKSLKRHCKRAEMHGGIRKYKCSYENCTKAYAHRPDLQRHESTAHKGIRPFVCTTCNKGFIRDRDLRLHARTHTGTKLYSCESCDASFDIYQEYKEHCKDEHGLSILIKHIPKTSE